MDPNTFELLKIIIGSGGFLSIFISLIILIFRTGKIVQKIEYIEIDITDIRSGITEIKKDIHYIESRLSRLEGRFDERGYWESRRTGTEHKDEMD